jgi:glycosyltransferase involved in cell wall biosynthesis
MKLLMLDQFSDPGGAQQMLLELLPAIRDRRWRTLVGLPGRGELFEQVRALGFDAERIECGPYGSGRKSAADVGRFLAGTPRLARQIGHMAQQVEADLVYLNGPRLLPAAALAGLECPVLYHSHSYLPAGVARTVAGFALRRMNARVVGACEFVAEPWRAYVAGERISVVFNGVTGPSGAHRRPSEGPPRIGCIGRIAPEKGQREFIAAAAHIHQSLPECRFAVYGSPLFGDAGSERYAVEVREAAAGLPVEFPGWVTDIYGAMAELDLLLVPSVGREATTRVILEAFAACLPVIALATGGIPEVVEAGVTGLLAESAEEMAQLAVVLLTGDPRRMISIARAARTAWQQRFTQEYYHDQLLRTIESAARQPTLA